MEIINKRKKLYARIPIIALILTLAVFLIKPINVPTPDKIIVYNNGVQKVLDKNSETFNKVVELTNKRFKKNLAVGKDIVDDRGMEITRSEGVGIEFVYPRNHFMLCTNPFIYDKLYFDIISYGTPSNAFQHALSGEYEGHSLGGLTYSEELVNMVTDIK